MRMVKHQNRLPKDTVDTACLETLMARLDVAAWSSWRCSSSLQRGWTRWPVKVSSNSNHLMILWSVKSIFGWFSVTHTVRTKFPWSPHLMSRHYTIDTETVGMLWRCPFPEYLQPCCVQDVLPLPRVCNTVCMHIFLPGNKYLFSRWLMRSLGSKRWQSEAQMWHRFAILKCEEY